jgi:hypothetical protein
LPRRPRVERMKIFVKSLFIIIYPAN